MVSQLKSFLKKRPLAVPVIVLVFATLIVFINALPNRLFWDDNDGIVNNIYIKDWHSAGKFFSENLIAGAGFMSNYWRPLLLVSYSAEWHLWGDWAPGYHLTNILIHLANAILILVLLNILFHRRWFACFTALIFAIHPLQTEAVTYVSGRGDLLSLLFILTGTLCYLKARTTGRGGYLAGTFASFLLALLTKERSVIFPAFLLLVDAIMLTKETWKGTARFLKNELQLLAPYLITAAGYLLLRATALNFQNTFNIYNAENVYTGNILVRFFTFLAMLPRYLGLTFAPVTLYMERSENLSPSTHFLDPWVIGGIIIILLFALAVSLTWKRTRLYAFGIGWFLIALFPASGIVVPVAGIMFEHYLYVPLVGIALACGAAFGMFVEKFPRTRLFLFIPVIFWLLFLGGRTMLRNAEWREPIAFYLQTLSHAPTSLRVWNNLGLEYANEERFKEAVGAYERASMLDPANAIPLHNLGDAYLHLGEEEKAVFFWERAITLDSSFVQPRHALSTYCANHGGKPKAACEKVR